MKVAFISSSYVLHWLYIAFCTIYTKVKVMGFIFLLIHHQSFTAQLTACSSIIYILKYVNTL